MRKGKRETWTVETRKEVAEVFVDLLVAHAHIAKEEVDFPRNAGYSIALLKFTTNVMHIIKNVGKFMGIEVLINTLEEGPLKNQLRATVLAAAKPCTKGKVYKEINFMDLFENYWYAHSSVALFANNRSKWDILPKRAQLFARLFEVIVDQYLTHDVSLLNIATYATCVFLHEVVARSLELHKPTSGDWGKNVMNYLQKKSAHSHWLKHSVQELEVSGRLLAFSCQCLLLDTSAQITLLDKIGRQPYTVSVCKRGHC